MTGTAIRKGDKVTRKADGKTGTAVTDQYTSLSGEAVVIRWDGATRPPLANLASKLRRIS